MQCLEFISFDENSSDVMPHLNFKKDPAGLCLIIQDGIPFNFLKNVLKAKRIENIFSGTAGPPRSNAHAIANMKDSVDSPLIHEKEVPSVIPEDTDQVESFEDDQYSYQDEAESEASTSYDQVQLRSDFDYDNRATVYEDVLDQKGYVEYVNEAFTHYPY